MVRAQTERLHREGRVKKQLEARGMDGTFLLQTRIARVQLGHMGSRRFEWARPPTPKYMQRSPLKHAASPVLPPALMHKSYSSYPPLDAN